MEILYGMHGYDELIQLLKDSDHKLLGGDTYQTITNPLKKRKINPEISLIRDGVFDRDTLEEVLTYIRHHSSAIIIAVARYPVTWADEQMLTTYETPTSIVNKLTNR